MTIIKKLLEYIFTLKEKVCYYFDSKGRSEEVVKVRGISICDVANFFLSIVDRDAGSTITPLKLQKILYYAQGYHLARFDKELFKEDFEAWAHGPANPKIYEKYKEYGFNAIDAPDLNDVPKFSDALVNFLYSIWEMFGIYDGKYLEELTHNEEPWIEARKGYEPGERCDVVISKKSMKKFFNTEPYSA